VHVPRNRVRSTDRFDMEAKAENTFSKVQPFLAELRAASGEPEFCKHMEAVVMAAPDAEAILARRREAIWAASRARRQGAGRPSRC